MEPTQLGINEREIRLSVRGITPSDAEAYKKIYVQLHREDGDHAAAARYEEMPIASYERMIIHQTSHGAIFRGLFDQELLVGFAGLTRSRVSSERMEFFGPAVLPDYRKNEQLVKLITSVLQSAREMKDITLITTEINPGSKHMRESLMNAGFEQFGYIAQATRLGVRICDAEFLCISNV